jgi:hypothetical protein
MRRAGLLGAAVALVLVAACARDSSAQFERRDVQSLVLAPSDLGAGYTYGDDTGCGRFFPEGASKEFTDFVADADPVACAIELNYIWGGVRTKVVPRGVDSGAVVFDDEADARRGLELRKELSEFITGESPRDFEALNDFGHEAVRFRSGGFDVPPGAGVIWRNGNMIAVVFAGGEGLTAKNAPDAAVALARKQQRRIEDPTPPSRDRIAEAELPLEDPALDAPVYWLGRTFDPGGGLLPVTFAKAYTYGGSGGEPSFTAEIDYAAADASKSSGVKLWVFRRDSFEGFERSVIGRFVRDTPCAEETKVSVPGGHAVVWGGFAKPTRQPCPARPYDRYFAHVFLEGAVVTINHPLCYYPCRANPRGTGDVYNTPRGLTAIARGLRVRR